MKTCIYFIATCFLSTGALMAGLNLKNPLPAFVIAFGVWFWFAWGWNRRNKKAAAKRMGEQLFSEHMRKQFRNLR